MIITIRKIWSFIKIYWYVPVFLIALLIAYFIFERDVDIFRFLKEKEKLYKKEINVIEKSNRSREKQIRKNQEEYIKDIEKIREEEKKKLLVGEKERTDRIKEIEKSHDLDEIMNKIKDKYDWR